MEKQVMWPVSSAPTPEYAVGVKTSRLLGEALPLLRFHSSAIRPSRSLRTNMTCVEVCCKDRIQNQLLNKETT